MYACTRSVFFQIRSIKKPVTFFKNGCKKLFSLQNGQAVLALKLDKWRVLGGGRGGCHPP